MKEPSPQPRGVFSRLVAKIRALLPHHWRGSAGEHFRDTAKEISEFAERHNLRPSDLADEVVTLSRRKIEGLANKEFAAAVKDFAETERIKIDVELQRRSLSSEVEKKKEEARLATIQRLNAELELLKKMKEVGAILREEEPGSWTVLPLPQSSLLDELIKTKALCLPEKPVEKEDVEGQSNP